MSILKMLDCETSNAAEKEKMLFVREYEHLIRQTNQLIEIANEIQEILKNNELLEKTKEKCMKLFDNVTDSKTLKFKDNINVFLTNTGKSVDGSDKILCSSNILESSFGKYKNYISDNISVGITNLSLSIPAFNSKLEPNEILKAMEEIKTNKIKDWSTLNIGETQTKKRRVSLKMERRKQCVTP